MGPPIALDSDSRGTTLTQRPLTTEHSRGLGAAGDYRGAAPVWRL